MPHPPMRGPPPADSYGPPPGRDMRPQYRYQNEHYGHSQGPPPPPAQRYHPNNAMRVPPPHYHEQFQGPPPPGYYPRGDPGYGAPSPGPWRDESLRRTPSYPPRYEYGRDMPPLHEEQQRYHATPRGPPPGLYMPSMQHSSPREGPPPLRMNSRLGRSVPEPQFKRSKDSLSNSKATTSISTDVKKTSSKESKGKKKGDALDLLAKVSSAMTEDEESDGGTEATAETKPPDAGRESTQQTTTPPRHHISTPPKSSHVYTAKMGYAPEHNAARQITPNTDQRRRPPAHYHDPYARHTPRDNYGPARDFYPPPPYYPRSHSPPAVISQRNSFEDGMGMGQEVVYYEGGSADMMDIDHPPPHQGHYERYPVRPEHYPPHLPPPPLPYTFVQQPRMENKTILRKKFSWKHYPELERFLIANRDEYLRHSALNYTAEQKQYNNWLTERLLELAARHHYIFDAEEFNFVAVRDRIRCYYKSYVQTSRKRGHPLTAPSPVAKKKTAGAAE